MAFTTTFTTSIRRGSTTLTDTRNYTSQAVYEVSETFADATTDGLLAINIDISQMDVIAMVSDQDITIKTNSSGAPVDTISLTAGQMFFQRTGDEAQFTADVTQMFVTNASGATATLQIIVGVDPTV